MGSESQPADILVVDDNDDGRETLAFLLRAAGFRVREGRTGADALRLAADHPDLVVLDVVLPDLSGFDVCRRIKTDPATAAIPVLYLSGTRVGDEDKSDGLEAGADGYLTKPVEPPELLAAVRSLVRLRRMEQAYARQARMARLVAEVVVALNQGDDLSAVLRQCAEAVVRHLGVTLARIWTLPPGGGGGVELQAEGSAEPADAAGVPDSVPAVDQVAREGEPYWTNCAAGDSRTGVWAAGPRGLTAFAGYPLRVEGRVVGVLAVFARRPIAEEARVAVAPVADAIALGIERKRAEAVRQEAERAERAARAQAERAEHLRLEMQTLERLAGPPPAAVTAQVFGTLPLRESHPDLFGEVVRHYGQVLDAALDQRQYKVAHNVSERLRGMGDRLGFARAGPRDVVEVYTAALKDRTAGVSAPKARAYAEEGRLLVLELMGHLVSYYRAAAPGAGPAPSRPPHSPRTREEPP